MTLLTTASRRAKRAEQSHFFMPTRLSGEERNKSIQLIWWMGLPLCLIVGAIANYGWHYRYDAARIRRVEVPHATALPYQFLPQNVEFTTENLPEITAEPGPKNAINLVVMTESIADKPVDPVVIEKTDGAATLKNRLEEAVNDTHQPSNTSNESILANTSSNIIELSALPLNIQRQVPTLTYSAHVYSSIPSNRSININGHECHEGDEVVIGIKLVEIGPEASIFQINSQKFILKALNDWDIH